MDQSSSHDPPGADAVSPRRMLTRSRSRPTRHASVNKRLSSAPSSRSSSSSSFDSQDSQEEKTPKPNRVFLCQICDKTFQSNYHLSRHARVHTGAKPFTSEIYGHNSTSNSTQIGHLRSHSRIVHEKVKQIECKLCPKKFATNQDLSIHLNKHTGAKPYKCDQCPKEFAAPSNLRTHRKSHSQSNKVFCGTIHS
jgi:KRAB domain-containing zinc finger protein